jgi:hypothetical protein
MRRGLLLSLLAFLLLATFVSPAQAATGPGNSWTQLDNHNWPDSSSNPNCSPCIRWTKSGPNGYYQGSWGYLITGDSFFHTQAQAAMAEWSGQPYYSPSFSESGCPANICVNAQNLGSTRCGSASYSYNTSSNLITHIDVYLNTQKAYSDGPSTQYCDVRSAYHHEIGHGFSEGHSAVSTDLMYRSQNKQEHVDADAESELRAVYGAISGSGGDGGGCPPNPCMASALKAKLLRLAQSLSGTVTLQQGVPAGV